MRILFVEDESALSDAAVPVLVAGGFTVDVVDTLADAMSAESVFPYDAVLLDRHLPDGDGLHLLRDLRKRKRHMPVIVMSAVRADLADRIHGLEGGADDYMVKPLVPTELYARLKAVLRRPGQLEDAELHLGGLSYDTVCRQVRIDGEAVSLARRETDVLECLVRAAGRVVSRGYLEEAIYGFNEDVSNNAIDVSMHRLRCILKSRSARVQIETVRGLGYILREAPAHV
ncbi:response regulator transcription factor [Yoonia vestfoldensis]|uniref:response regulator transcription factor n=1 Tax=Yoonia vestfoldensis TaxID=245188 RepID=UPI00047827B8|nr:response regulator transcription factor [Yoonia vestfoldensis]